MLEVECSGSPYELGLQHGTAAKSQITRGIAFYASLFATKSNMSWTEVTPWASKYLPYLTASHPSYVSEMQGIAAGAGVPFLDILAMNVRTEIAFGAFSDGCTAIAHKPASSGNVILAQNWDWDTTQAENLLKLTLTLESGLKISMVTEAGIIGKIGLNSLGVGCTLNAIKAKGVSFTQLPCHLALRTVLESSSREEAIAKLEATGVASACHILIADKTGATGLECSTADIIKLETDSKGIVAHTNHYILPHAPEVIESTDWLPDTRFRLSRVGELLDIAIKEGGISSVTINRILEDEVEGNGAAICRLARAENQIQTLFRVVMDLNEAMGVVTVGRPTEGGAKLTLLGKGGLFRGVEVKGAVLAEKLPQAQKVM